MQVAIKKQEFYEGAAIHLLARQGCIKSIQYNSPFFIINDNVFALLKYSTKNRSPWAFTLTRDEQTWLSALESSNRVFVGLICGSDGVAALGLNELLAIARKRDVAVHLSCHRNYSEHYEVKGPDGILGRKVAPSAWRKILD
jgi:hypothetical protein